MYMTSSPHSLTQKRREINNNHYALNVFCFFFSGLSVVGCIKFRTGYLLPTLARKITCQHFDWNLQSSSGQKWRSLKKHCYLWTSSILVEVLLWECNLDVQGLFHQQFLSSAMVQHCDLFPVDQEKMWHSLSSRHYWEEKRMAAWMSGISTLSPIIQFMWKEVWWDVSMTGPEGLSTRRTT